VIRFIAVIKPTDNMSGIWLPAVLKPFSVAVKWTAPEVVLDTTISIFSNVWSFGIVMVEMMTFGGEPYPGKCCR
jgi:serine/threonine protein kinase